MTPALSQTEAKEMGLHVFSTSPTPVSAGHFLFFLSCTKVVPVARIVLCRRAVGGGPENGKHTELEGQTV